MAKSLIPVERIEKKELVTNCDHLSQLKFSPALLYAFTELLRCQTGISKRRGGSPLNLPEGHD